ncbi:MAG: hypothetical protein ACRCXY_11470 [Fusobacteriaceae bacterium]
MKKMKNKNKKFFELQPYIDKIQEDYPTINLDKMMLVINAQRNIGKT